MDASLKGSGRYSSADGGGRVEAGDGSRWNLVPLKNGTTGALLSYSLDRVRGLATFLSRSSKVLDLVRGDIFGSSGSRVTIGRSGSA